MDLASRSNPIAIGIVCGIGASLFWATGIVGIRYGLNAGFTPADLAMHRFVWFGLAMLPSVMRAGIGNLYGVGWGRGLSLAMLGGPIFAAISYAGFRLVPIGYGGIIQPSCIMLGGLLLAAFLLGEKIPAARGIGALIIVCGLIVIGADAVISIGVHGVTGDLIFVATGLMFASFGTLLRMWCIAPIPAATVVSFLSLLTVPAYWALGDFDHTIALGWRENLLQALLQGVLMGYGALYLFVRCITLLGAGRAAVFPALVPPFVLLFGWLALGEVPSVLQLTGLVIILLGFWLAQRAA